MKIYQAKYGLQAAAVTGPRLRAAKLEFAS
jgi:hypothetical protein